MVNVPIHAMKYVMQTLHLLMSFDALHLESCICKPVLKNVICSPMYGLCSQYLPKPSQCFLPVWMCRWKTQSGLVVVWSWSWSPCSSSYLLPVYLWLPWLLQPVRKHWRLHVDCSLPCHLHRTTGSVTFLLDFFFLRWRGGGVRTKDRESK